MNRSRLNRILKYTGWACACLTLLLAGLILSYAAFSRFYYQIVQADIPVFLGTDFVLVEHPDLEKDTRMITDKKGNVLVQGNIKSLMLQNNTVYGYRDNPWQHKEMWFICALHESCAMTQDYNALDFQKELRRRNLPSFQNAPSQSVSRLILKENVKQWFIPGPPAQIIVNENTIENPILAIDPLKN